MGNLILGRGHLMVVYSKEVTDGNLSIIKTNRNELKSQLGRTTLMKNKRWTGTRTLQSLTKNEGRRSKFRLEHNIIRPRRRLSNKTHRNVDWNQYHTGRY